MFKAVSLVAATLVLAFALGNTAVVAQSKEDGMNIANEGEALQEKAQSAEDLKKAIEKYEQALKIFEAVKFHDGLGQVLNNLGRIYHGWGQYDKAVGYFDRALALSKDFNLPEREAATLNNLGRVYVPRREYDKAVQYYERALAISQELKNLNEEGRALSDLGMIYAHRGQNSKAAEFLEKSLLISRDIKDSKLEALNLNRLGLIYMGRGQSDKAAEFFEKSLAMSRELKDSRGEAQALNNLGLIHGSQGQYDRAAENHEKSLAINRRLKDPRGEALNLSNLGQGYRARDQYDKAVEYFETSLAMYRELRDPREEARILIQLGQVYRVRGQYDKAVEYFETSLAMYRELKDPRGEAGALHSLGGIYSYLGQHNRTVAFYEQSLAINREIKSPRGEAGILLDLGLAYADRGQYDKAVEHYEKSLAISRQIRQPELEAGVLRSLGQVYSGWGQYDRAVEYFERALAITRELKDPRQERVLNSLGGIYAQWGQFDKAVEYFEKSLEINRELKDPKGEGRALSNLGNVYAAQGRYPDALVNLQKALDIYKTIGVPIQWQANNIGNLYLDMGEAQKAESFIKQGNYSVSLGRLSLIKGDYASARNYYEKLLASAEKNRNVNNLFTAYTGLGTIYEATGDDKKAEEYFSKAVNLTEELRSTLPTSERETFFDVRINGFLRTAPYDGLARVRIKMNRPNEAFKDSEYTKSRVFAETMSKWSEGASFDIPADVLKQDRQLNDQLSALRNKRQEAYEKANSEMITVIEPQVKEMENKLSVHIKMIREKYPVFAATKYPEPMNLKQTAVKENEWILSYHVTDSGIIVYLTKGKEIVQALFKPYTRNDLDSLILTFRRPLEIIPGKDKFEDKLMSFDLAAGKKLSDLLLSDILEKLPKNVSVHIVPDDSLGMLPFEMLVLNDRGSIKSDKDLPYISGAEFFGDRNLISYCQSVTALTLSRIHAKSSTNRSGLLCIVDPVFHEKDDRTPGAPTKQAPSGAFASLCKKIGLMAADEDGSMGGLKFQRLSLTGDLGKKLADMHEKGSHICTGFDASKSNFLDTIAPQLNRYDKVVFATHGYFGKDLPGIMEPVLVLTLIPPGTDGFLRMTEVMGLNINADIVALTACQTGLGKRTAGEGTMGMGRAFQYAGAKSVLMSLWSVSEVASTRLVESFFRNLKEGKSKSEALVAARGQLRKGVWDHPFFWAGFILVGETN